MMRRRQRSASPRAQQPPVMGAGHAGPAASQDTELLQQGPDAARHQAQSALHVKCQTATRAFSGQFQVPWLMSPLHVPARVNESEATAGGANTRVSSSGHLPRGQSGNEEQRLRGVAVWTPTQYRSQGTPPQQQSVPIGVVSDEGQRSSAAGAVQLVLSTGPHPLTTPITAPKKAAQRAQDGFRFKNMNSEEEAASLNSTRPVPGGSDRSIPSIPSTDSISDSEIYMQLDPNATLEMDLVSELHQLSVGAPAAMQRDAPVRHGRRSHRRSGRAAAAKSETSRSQGGGSQENRETDSNRSVPDVDTPVEARMSDIPISRMKA